MKPAIPFEAFFLAGGSSTRMGQDKALLQIGGQPILLHMVSVIREVAERVTVVAPPERYAHLGLQVVPDDAPGLGPLGGLLTALRLAEKDWLFLTGCDLPFLHANWPLYLAERAAVSTAQIILPVTPGGAEPLCAMYHRSSATALRAAADRGVRKMSDALAGAVLEQFPVSDWIHLAEHPRLFQNVNRPEDWAEVQDWLGEASRAIPPRAERAGREGPAPAKDKG